MPRIIGNNKYKFYKPSALIALVISGFICMPLGGWAANQTITAPTDTQQLITSEHNALVVGANLTATNPANNDVIIFDNTALGTTALTNNNDVTIIPPIVSGSTGAAIIVDAAATITAPATKLAINGNAATTAGNLFINNSGTIRAGGAADVIKMGTGFAGNMKLTNSGTITGHIEGGGNIDELTNSGTINGNIDLKAGSNIIRLHGISPPVVNGNMTADAGANTLYIGESGTAATFSTAGTITNMQTINVVNTTGTNFTINNVINGTSTLFHNQSGATTNLELGGDLSGGGAITNDGTINTPVGNVGAATPMGAVTNNKEINFNGGNVTVGAFTNNHADSDLNISGGVVRTGDIANNDGTIDITGGVLEGATADNSSLTNAESKIINLVNPGTIGTTNPLAAVTNSGTINLGNNATIGDFTNAAGATALNITGGVVRAGNIDNQDGTIHITGGELSARTAGNSSLTNAESKTITLNGGTIGTTARLGTVTNSGRIDLADNAAVGAFLNNHANAQLNITGGNTSTGDITNTAGEINITGGDLSGETADTYQLINETSQEITLNGGTIGVINALGAVTNRGTINLANNATVGNFINNDPAAVLNINGGIIKTNNINNADGAINIIGGELSSKSAGASNLINAAGKTIALTAPGEMGATTFALGTITNSGTMALGGNATVGDFTNNHVNARLNITDGNIATGAITNTAGAITINHGDLSGAGLNLAVDNDATINLTGDGTMGANGAANPWGAVTNSGTIELGGGNVTMGAFTNDNASSLLNITNGNIATGAITNTAGAITINHGDLSGTAASLALGNNASITLSGDGTMGANSAANPWGDVTNQGTINLGGSGTALFGAFENDNANAKLNISDTVTVTSGDITNTAGEIKITGGDLSGATNIPLINDTGNNVTVTAPGTLGANQALGVVTNRGTINLGNDATMGAFTNNNAAAALNITGGNIVTGAITNTAGAITINHGDLSGTAAGLALGNDASITLSGDGTMGAHGAANPWGAVTNSGTIELGGGNVTMGAFTNDDASSLLNITNGNIAMGAITNTAGAITINHGDLSGTAASLALGNNASITLSGDGTMGANSAANPWGDVTNQGTINLGGSGTALFGAFTNDTGATALNISDTVTVRTDHIVNNAGLIHVSGGDLSGNVINTSNLTNEASNEIRLTGTGTIGKNFALNTITNRGEMNLGGSGEVFFGDFTNNDASAELNIKDTVTVRTGNITNTDGAINITGGDLSGKTADNSTLTNALNKIITLTSPGTIGANGALANITNTGTINLGNNATFGNFTNAVGATGLNITGGIVKTGNITNTDGAINITGGDLSGKTADDSILTNPASKTVALTLTGTIGVNNALKTITNAGMITLNGGDAHVSTFTNDGASAALTIDKGTLYSNTFNNTDGTVDVNAGDISSITANTGTLTNAATKTITVDSTGRIGEHNRFGLINNQGILTLDSGGIINTVYFIGTAPVAGGVGLGTLNAVVDASNLSGLVFDGTNLSGTSTDPELTFPIYLDIATNGDITNVGTINLFNNDFTINNSVSLNDNYNTHAGTTTTINMGGNLSGTATVSNLGDIVVNGGSLGTSSTAITNATNVGAITLGAGGIYTDKFTNNGGTLTINQDSMLTGDIVNDEGTIAIAGGNLSGIAADKTLVNNLGSTINVTNSGEIGTSATGYRLGATVNYGTINANGSDIKIGKFTQNNSAAQLNISQGNILTRDIVNTLGSITISGGDLSSDAAEIVNRGNITNGGTITLSGGTIGNQAVIGDLNNSGIISSNDTTTAEIKVTNITNNTFGQINLNNQVTATNITNNGYFNLKSGGIVNASAFNNSGELYVLGTINAPINITSGNASVSISGGSVSQVNGSNGFGLKFLTASTVANPINKVETIEVKNSGTVLNVNSDITENISSFTVDEGTTVNINATGTLSGNGDINNAGIINIGYPVAGTLSGTVAGTTNLNTEAYGTINVNGDNGIIVLTGPEYTTGNITGTANVAGTIDLSAGTVTTAAGTGTISLNNDITTDIVNMGNINNTSSINLMRGNIKTNEIHNQSGATININVPVTTGLSGANTITNQGTMNINYDGNLSSNVLGSKIANYGELNVNGTGKLMDASTNSKLGDFTNYGQTTINNSDGLKIYNNLTNSYYDDANIEFKISKGNIEVGGINNNYGKITIGNVAVPANTPDLSSINAAKPAIITNSASGTIEVVGGGKIGATTPLGTVTNQGTINFSGGAVKIGEFTNNSNSAALTVTENTVQTGNITNTAGTITVGEDGGTSTPDLSSINDGAGGTSLSTLINNEGTYLRVLGAGTIGATNPLGAVTNKGVINFKGGNVQLGEFINNGDSAALTITKNTVQTGNITNTAGTITIGETGETGTPDLSSINDGTGETSLSTLTNGIGQTIEVINNGTIGAVASKPLGAVTNQGTINFSGGEVKIGDFTNNYTDSASSDMARLNITQGNISVGNISNDAGLITIGDVGTAGDLSATVAGNSSLYNAEGQTITVGGTATIGANNKLGTVNNYGTINLGGGEVKVGEVNNLLTTSVLNITKGLIRTSNINNTKGSINISGDGIDATDLSSEEVADYSNLTNAASQTITIETGTLGANRRLGTIDNYGTITATTSAFKAGNFVNYSSGVTSITNTQNNGVELTGLDNYGTFTLGATSDQSASIAGAITNQSTGVLNVNAKIDNYTSIDNQSGGVINLNAEIKTAIGNTFTNSGTLNILQNVSMTHGDYTLGATGKHVTTVSDGKANVLALSTGDAEFDNGCSIEINKNSSDDFIFKNGESFPIIKANNDISGYLGNINIVGGTELLQFNPETVSSGGVDNVLQLVTVRKPMDEVLKTKVDYQSTSQETFDTFGTILDKVINSDVTGDLRTVLAKIDQFYTAESVKDATNQLLPHVNNVSEIGFNGADLSFQATESRLDMIARSGINQMYAGGARGYSAGSLQSNAGVWVKGVGGSNKQKQRDNFLGYNSTSYGTAIGADREIIANGWLGISLSALSSRIKNKDTTQKKTNVNSYQATLYGSYSTEDYYIDNYLGLAINGFKTARNIKISGFNRTPTAKYYAAQPSYKMSAGYIQGVDNFRAIPNVSMQYSVLNQPEYKEDGAGNAGMRVAKAKLSQFELGAGIKLSYFYQESENFICTPDIHFMYLHDFKENSHATVAEFLNGGGKFRVQTMSPNKDTVNLGAGVKIIGNNQLHLIADYDVKIKDKFVGHSGSLAVRFEL